MQYVKKKKKLPSSKFLTYVVTWVWVIAVILSFLGYFFFTRDNFTILITVSSSFSVVLNGFFLKSYLENKSEYGSSNTVISSSFENTTTHITPVHDTISPV
jgi:hypothetical protein